MAETKTLTNLVKYDVTKPEITAVAARYAGLSAATPAGYEEVRLAIAHVRDVRVAVEKRRVELKADALAYGRLVDSEAKRLTELLLEIEEPLKLKKAEVDNEKERVKNEEAAAKLRAIQEEIERNRAKQEAELRAAREAEEKRLADERAALEAERKKLAEAQAVLDAQRKAEEERLAAARRAEEDRAAAARKVEEDRLAAERTKRLIEEKAEADRIALEREKLEQERRRVAAEREAQERAEFERQAKIKAEREAKEALERERVEKARRDAELAALTPDVEKVAAFVAEIRALKAPKVKAPKVALVLADTVARLIQAAEETEAAFRAKGWKL